MGNRVYIDTYKFVPTGRFDEEPSYGFIAFDDHDIHVEAYQTDPFATDPEMLLMQIFEILYDGSNILPDMIDTAMEWGLGLNLNGVFLDAEQVSAIRSKYDKEQEALLS